MRILRARKLVAVLVIIPAVVFVVLAGVPVLVRWGVFDRILAERLSKAAGRPVEIGGAKLSLLSGLTIDSVRSLTSQGDDFVFTIERIEVAENVLDLASGRLRHIVIASPSVRLPVGAIKGLAPGASGTAFEAIEVRNGTLTLLAAGGPVELRRIALSAFPEGSPRRHRFTLSTDGVWGELESRGLIDSSVVTFESVRWSHPRVGRLAARLGLDLSARAITNLSLTTSDLDLGALHESFDFIDWPMSPAGVARVSASQEPAGDFLCELVLRDASLSFPEGQTFLEHLSALVAVRFDASVLRTVSGEGAPTSFSPRILAHDLSFSSKVERTVYEARAEAVDATLSVSAGSVLGHASVFSPSFAARDSSSRARFARIDASVRPGEKSFSVALDATAVSLSRGGRTLDDLSASLRLERTGGSAAVVLGGEVSSDRLGRLAIDDAAAWAQEGRLKARVSYEGTPSLLAWDAANPLAELLKKVRPAARLDLQYGNGTLLGRGTVSLEAPDTKTSLPCPLSFSIHRDGTAKIASEALDLSPLWANTQTLLGGAAADWQLSGSLSFESDVTPPAGAGGPWKVVSSIHLVEGGIETPEFNGFEGLSASIRLSALLDASFEHARASVEADLSGLSYVFGLFHGEHSNELASLAGEGEVSVSPLRVTDANGSFLIGNIAKGKIRSASFDAKGIEGSVVLERLDLKQAFDEFVRGPFGEVYPFLKSATVEGTIGSEDLGIRLASGHPSILGKLELHDASFVSGPFEARNLSGILPFNFNREEEGEPLAGELSVGKLALSPLVYAGESLALVSRPSGVRLRNALPIDLPGGRILASDFDLNWKAGDEIVRSRVETDSVDLASLTGALLPGFAFPGTLYGRFESVTIGPEGLSSSGKAVASVFGGTVELTDIGVAHLFKAVRTYRFSARLADIGLAPLSQFLRIGTISGRLGGEIRSFEIAAGRPNAWAIDFETKRAPHVEQWVSPDFVKNMTYFTSGFIMRPFESSARRTKLAYERFGITSRLRNNYIRIEGKIKEGGKEYFMKAGPFGGVNIINAQPGLVYSFREIFDRVRAVLAGGAGPAIEVK
ncbi:MAG: hypothetical protein V2A58_12180 [Planctomycetota bacterium]